jgi:hypothetical protein
VATCWFQVAGARPPHTLVTAPGHLVKGKGPQQQVDPKLALKAAEHLLIRAAGRDGQVRLGEERRGGFAERPSAGGEGDDPAGHGGSSAK